MAINNELSPKFVVRGFQLRPKHALLVILLISLFLRLLLLVNGGQFHFPDEVRYGTSINVAGKIVKGDFKAALGTMLQYRSHPGFATAALIPALIHSLTLELFDTAPTATGGNYFHDGFRDFRIPVIFFLIPSVLSIAMIYFIAREAGAEEVEALLAALFAATSNALFIYSRHLVPYDISLLIALAALFISLRFRETGIFSALLVGVLVFCAFWIYFGHIFLLIVISVVYCFGLARKPQDMILRPIGMALGVSIPFIPILIYTHAVQDVDVPNMLMTFASKVDQGQYEEGMIFPFLYAGETEGATAVVWLIGICMAVKHLLDKRENSARRLLIWLAVLVSLYLLMAILSSGLHTLVLYGRTVRTLVPFVALICGFSFASWLKRFDLRVFLLFVFSFCLFAIIGFAPAIRLQFYREVARFAYANFEEISFETTFRPPSRAYEFSLPKVDGARYLLVNAGYYGPVTEMTTRPEGEVILEVSHPYNYRPFQYEGMTPEMREIINRDGVYMWLIDTEAAEGS